MADNEGTGSFNYHLKNSRESAKCWIIDCSRRFFFVETNEWQQLHYRNLLFKNKSIFMVLKELKVDLYLNGLLPDLISFERFNYNFSSWIVAHHKLFFLSEIRIKLTKTEIQCSFHHPNLWDAIFVSVKYQFSSVVCERSTRSLTGELHERNLRIHPYQLSLTELLQVFLLNGYP
jgi:hypothetical protein